MKTDFRNFVTTVINSEANKTRHSGKLPFLPQTAKNARKERGTQVPPFRIWVPYVCNSVHLLGPFLYYHITVLQKLDGRVPFLKKTGPSLWKLGAPFGNQGPKFEETWSLIRETGAPSREMGAPFGNQGAPSGGRQYSLLWQHDKSYNMHQS